MVPGLFFCISPDDGIACIQRADALREVPGVVQHAGEELAGGEAYQCFTGGGIGQGGAVAVAADAEAALFIVHEAQRPDPAFEGALLARQGAALGGVEQRAVAALLRGIGVEAQGNALRAVCAGAERNSTLRELLSLPRLQKRRFPGGLAAEMTAQAAV